VLIRPLAEVEALGVGCLERRGRKIQELEVLFWEDHMIKFFMKECISLCLLFPIPFILLFSFFSRKARKAIVELAAAGGRWSYIYNKCIDPPQLQLRVCTNYNSTG
jgi:hypothetical protein